MQTTTTIIIQAYFTQIITYAKILTIMMFTKIITLMQIIPQIQMQNADQNQRQSHHLYRRCRSLLVTVYLRWGESLFAKIITIAAY